MGYPHPDDPILVVGLSRSLGMLGPVDRQAGLSACLVPFRLLLVPDVSCHTAPPGLSFHHGLLGRAAYAGRADKRTSIISLEKVHAI